MFLFRNQNLQTLKIVYDPVGAPKQFTVACTPPIRFFRRVLPLQGLDLSEALASVVLIHVLVETYGGQMTSLRIQSAVCTKALREILRNLQKLLIYHYHVIPKTLGHVEALLSGNSTEGRLPWLTNLKLFPMRKHVANIFSLGFWWVGFPGGFGRFPLNFNRTQESWSRFPSLE